MDGTAVGDMQMEETSLRDMDVDGRDQFERHGCRWKRTRW